VIKNSVIEFILRVVRTSYLTSCASSELNMLYNEQNKFDTRYFLSHIIFIANLF